MADIINLAALASAGGDPKDARIGILRSLVCVSMELRQIQRHIAAAAGLDEHEKLMASQAILVAAKALHGTAATVEHSLTGATASSQP